MLREASLWVMFHGKASSWMMWLWRQLIVHTGGPTTQIELLCQTLVTSPPVLMNKLVFVARFLLQVVLPERFDHIQWFWDERCSIFHLGEAEPWILNYARTRVKQFLSSGEISQVCQLVWHVVDWACSNDRCPSIKGHQEWADITHFIRSTLLLGEQFSSCNKFEANHLWRQQDGCPQDDSPGPGHDPAHPR